MKFIYIGFLVAAALFLLYIIYYGLVRRVTRELRTTIRSLEAEIKDLRAAEPEKVRRLREELTAYDALVDEIQDVLVQEPSPLELSTPRERISNVIVARRPRRVV